VVLRKRRQEPDGTDRYWGGTMDQGEIGELAGRQCRLLRPVRDHEGHTRFEEQPTILRQIHNLDRSMYLVQFPDGATTFLFPDEVMIE
jgi:hypothetical protein